MNVYCPHCGESFRVAGAACSETGLAPSGLSPEAQASGADGARETRAGLSAPAPADHSYPCRRCGDPALVGRWVCQRCLEEDRVAFATALNRGDTNLRGDV
jgi:predicted RNA-binding Zn-ribbon protein involved in translation (DUF1610 family)